MEDEKIMGIFRSINQDNSTSISSPYKVDVKEIKAPTDESIRLLKEMQEKSLQSIVETLPVVNNNVTFVISQIQDPLNFGRWLVKVTINSVEHTTIINNDFKDRYQLAEEICNWFSSLFSRYFLEGIFTQELQKGRY